MYLLESSRLRDAVPESLIQENAISIQKEFQIRKIDMGKVKQGTALVNKP